MARKYVVNNYNNGITIYFEAPGKYPAQAYGQSAADLEIEAVRWNA